MAVIQELIELLFVLFINSEHVFLQPLHFEQLINAMLIRHFSRLHAFHCGKKNEQICNKRITL